MKKILLLMLLATATLQAVAQKNSIMGRVVDSDSEPIDGVVVVMLSSDDATLLGSSVTLNDGSFEMMVSATAFTLLFEHIAFESLSKEYYDEVTQLGDIALIRKSIVVDELIVKGYRPIVKAESGKLTYDLSQLSEQTTATNVYEALSYLPGVDEDDGELTLAGLGSISVIINGKPSTMSSEQLEQLLRSMPIERIESAEVMYSTPPQYGVRGASINLVLTQSRDHSYSGQLKSGYSHQRQSSYNAGGSFMVSSPKWSADAMYNYSDYYSSQILDLSTVHTVSGQTQSIEQYEDVYSLGRNHSFRAAFDYTPTANHLLSVVYNGVITPSSHTTSDSQGSYVESLSDKDEDNQLHNISLRYKAASGFDVGADYTNYKNGSSGSLSNIYSDGTETSFDVVSGQAIERLNLYADMAHSLSGGWGISYGAKAAWAEDKDHQSYSSVSGAIETTNTDSSLTEVSAEIYGGFSKNIAQGSVSASLTGEYYTLEGDERYSLYPQANLMWMFDANNIVQANISSTKTYPSYWMLQDAISYVDGYTEIHGNPYLSPMRTYSTQAIYILKQRYVFVLFATQTNDFFSQCAYLSPDSFSLIYKNTNFDFVQQYGANVVVPLSFGQQLTSKATLTALKSRHKCSDFFGASFDRSSIFVVAMLDNTIRVSDNLSLEINALYHTPTIQGLFDLDSGWGVDAGVKYSLIDKKLNLTAKCSDIFESRTPAITQNYQGQQLSFYTGAYSRRLSINLSYTFGGYTNKERKEVDSSRFGH